MDRGRKDKVASKDPVGEERKPKISHLEKFKQLSPKREIRAGLAALTNQ